MEWDFSLTTKITEVFSQRTQDKCREFKKKGCLVSQTAFQFKYSGYYKVSRAVLKVLLGRIALPTFCASGW
jgi:hypothetical protein